MIGDRLIVDATVHGYNWSESNWASPRAVEVVEPSYGFHASVSPGESLLEHDEWVDDWTVDMVEPVIFGESPIDLACYHATPQFDFFKDGQNAYEKGVELKRRNPDRVLVYGAVNPYHDSALDEVRRMKEEDDIDGVKVFAASFENNRPNALRLDTHDVAFPFIEGLLDMGINILASHKAVPLGPNRTSDYNVDDLDEPAAMFPEMKFEIVHSGFAFLEETALLMRFENVWSNLEATNSLVLSAPRRFAEIIGMMLAFGGEDRIVFASGAPLVHPLPVLEALLDFQIPQEVSEQYGYPQITDEIRSKILGENYLRLHGIDSSELRSKIADDKWSQVQAEGPGMWSHLRAG